MAHHKEDAEERLERQAQEHLEAAALAAMDPADREYLERAPYTMSDAEIQYRAELAAQEDEPYDPEDESE